MEGYCSCARWTQEVILDIDATDDETHGAQAGPPRADVGIHDADGLVGVAEGRRVEIREL